jgi:hypothetical protein
MGCSSELSRFLLAKPARGGHVVRLRRLPIESRHIVGPCRNSMFGALGSKRTRVTLAALRVGSVRIASDASQ